MANIQAIHSVGQSMATFLRNTYPDTVGAQAMPQCDFALVSSGELAGTIDDVCLWGVARAVRRMLSSTH